MSAEWTGCSSLAINEDMIASIKQSAYLLIIDLARPWPAKIFQKEFMPAPDAVERGKVLFADPREEDAKETQLRVSLYYASRQTIIAKSLMVEPSEISQLIADLEKGDFDSFGGEDDYTQRLLLCAHGQHDSCCGKWGFETYKKLKDTKSPLSIDTCSHLGGHRFAATAMLLPGAHVWGRLHLANDEQLKALLEGELDQVSDFYRGNYFEPEYLAPITQFLYRERSSDSFYWELPPNDVVEKMQDDLSESQRADQYVVVDCGSEKILFGIAYGERIAFKGSCGSDEIKHRKLPKLVFQRSLTS